MFKANPSVIVDTQAPEFIRSDYAKFITFLQKYYQFLEQTDGALNVIRNLDTFNDIDEQTNDQVLGTFYSLFLPDFPQFVAADKKFVLKHIAQFYNSKGSIDSIKAFFRILYGEEVQVYLPKEDILKLNAGNWRKSFKIKAVSLSSGTVQDLNGVEIYQLDPITGNKTVKAKVVDYNISTGLLYLVADNIILNFQTNQLVYATNLNGVAVSFSLQNQFSTTSVSYSGQNYAPGEKVILKTDKSNTENILVENVSKGTVDNLIISSPGDNYSILDKVEFGTPNDGEVPASARIISTINKDLTSELSDVLFIEPENRILFDDSSEMKQEYGNFGTPAATPNLKVSDESTTNLNTGSISSQEFGFLLEDQGDTNFVRTLGSYTYNQGLFRPVLPRIGASSNYSINYARNEGIKVHLQDEELWISSLYCAEGTPANPGTVIIQFETDSDYNCLEYYTATERSTSSNPPTIGVVNTDNTSERVLDSKIKGYTLQQQLGIYDFGAPTLTPLYPFSENFDSETSLGGPTMYIRETNTNCGHDFSTTRPWEYRFVFQKNSNVKLKIYIMPVQIDLRSQKLVSEDGTYDFYEENDSTNILLQEVYDSTINRVGFDPSNVTANQITVPNHGFAEGEIIRYNTFTDNSAGIQSDTIGGIVDGQIFYCHVVDTNTIMLMPYGGNNESLNYGLYQTITPAATVGTITYFTSFVGAHVTNGVDYTSTDVSQSAITINARKRAAGTRDLAMKHNYDPNTPVDATTKLKTHYPYTTDGKVYLYQSIVESTDYINLERNDFDNSTVSLSLEIAKANTDETEQYSTYSFLATETSTQTVIQNIKDISIPDYSNARVSVERKTLQSVNDVNRGTQRLPTVWNDYAEYSVYQDLFNFAKSRYNDEYSDSQYLMAAVPSDTTTYTSGPSEISNMGFSMMIASSKGNSVYYSDGTGVGNYKYAAELAEQRRISFVETPYYDANPLIATTQNGPLGVTSSSQGAYNSNAKRYYTINFAIPKEFASGIDVPFEVSLTNIVNSLNMSPSYVTIDMNEYFTMEGRNVGESVLSLESGDQVANETNIYGYKSLAQGNMSSMDPTVMLEFFSPSLDSSNSKKHLVYYANKADYTQVSSDTQRTIFSFYNCWSPTSGLVPDTTVKDYTISVKTLDHADFVIDKVSDTQLLANNPTSSVVNNKYISPFIKDIYVKTGVNDYGKYIQMYPTYLDSVNDTNRLTPFSLGSDFGSNLSGNEMFYNTVTSGNNVNLAFTNPLSKAFTGMVKDSNISMTRYFDPSSDVSSNTITINNHGLVSGSWVRFRSDFNGQVVTGLTDNTSYYVTAVTANTIKLSTTKDNYTAAIYVSLTPNTTTGYTCSLQTIPQSLTFHSVKDLSFDTRQYVNQIQITAVDTISGIIFTAAPHGLATLNTFKYTTSGTVIGNMSNGNTYYAIFVDSNQIKIATTKQNAVNGINLVLTSAGTGTQYVNVLGENGNMLGNSTNKEQELYTPGQYTNVLKTGDQVTFRDERAISTGISSGSTMFVRNSQTGTQESFALTTNSNLTSSNFGVSSVTSNAVSVANDEITATNHTFYTGDQVTYIPGATSITTASGNIPTTLYVVKTGTNTFKLASSFYDTTVYNYINITGAGSGTHYFYLTNTTTASEIAEVIPYSTDPNYAAMMNPAVTGTGFEEFTISYYESLQTETGYLDKIQLLSAGSYAKIPTVNIITADNRTGAGADVYPIVNNVGSISSLEILDGGTHSSTEDLYFQDSFFCDGSQSSSFVIGESILVNGGWNYGTIVSKSGHYFKVQPNNKPYARLTLGQTFIGATSNANGIVGRVQQISSITAGSQGVISTGNYDHNLQYGDMVQFETADANGYGTGVKYYAIPITNNTFSVSIDPAMTSIATAVGTNNTAIFRTGLYTAAATASPGAITVSTENGSSDNYANDKGLLNTWSKVQDSEYYQDYSYVVRGANSHENWKPHFNKLVHPAGMAVHGEVDYFTESAANQKLGNTVLVGTLINNTNVAITSTMTT